ncbi:MAG TPA: hypothetical protein VD813_08925 [Pseudonocardia sp.]|nr:hypothetical protein [Pseudonocardia sp.]
MHGTSEPDVERDHHTARTRETGGLDADRERRRDDNVDPDGPSTTGVDENETFVGRVSGQDSGFAGETGAEARAEAAREEGSR